MTSSVQLVLGTPSDGIEFLTQFGNVWTVQDDKTPTF